MCGPPEMDESGFIKIKGFDRGPIYIVYFSVSLVKIGLFTRKSLDLTVIKTPAAVSLIIIICASVLTCALYYITNTYTTHLCDITQVHLRVP